MLDPQLVVDADYSRTRTSNETMGLLGHGCNFAVPLRLFPHRKLTPNSSGFSRQFIGFAIKAN
jgi:hypothetical protein